MKRYILLFLLLNFTDLKGQNPNPYGLQIINDLNAYKEYVKADSSKELLELKKHIPGLKLDIRYASKNNFTGQVVYKQARAFARRPVTESLRNVQLELNKAGLGLKIFDAYRPYTVTRKFFEIASDKNFVANPKDGSRHNRGCAIDLTLIDLKTGKELAMPTPYDSFAPEAASDFKDLPLDVIKNRDLLRTVMEKNNFRVLNNEWWHFDFIGWRNFELMDIPFEDL